MNNRILITDNYLNLVAVLSIWFYAPAHSMGQLNSDDFLIKSLQNALQQQKEQINNRNRALSAGTLIAFTNNPAVDTDSMDDSFNRIFNNRKNKPKPAPANPAPNPTPGPITPPKPTIITVQTEVPNNSLAIGVGIAGVGAGALAAGGCGYWLYNSNKKEAAQNQAELQSENNRIQEALADAEEQNSENDRLFQQYQRRLQTIENRHGEAMAQLAQERASHQQTSQRLNDVALEAIESISNLQDAADLREEESLEQIRAERERHRTELAQHSQRNAQDYEHTYNHLLRLQEENQELQRQQQELSMRSERSLANQAGSPDSLISAYRSTVQDLIKALEQAHTERNQLQTLLMRAHEQNQNSTEENVSIQNQLQAKSRYILELEKELEEKNSRTSQPNPSNSDDENDFLGFVLIEHLLAQENNAQAASITATIVNKP